MKRAFLIVGAENSGNRMMRKAFMAAGCHGNPENGLDVWDLKQPLPPRIVLARSVPNGDVIPDVKGLARACELAGYAVVPVHIYRKTEFAIEGQVKGYQRTPERALEYRHLATLIAYELAAWLGTPLVVVPYEPFVMSCHVRVHLFASLGLTAPAIDTFNANEKYQLDGPPLPY